MQTQLHAQGIAHLSFLGGSMLLPARSPYDRQVLVEHIKDRARTTEWVQVLVDDRRWMVKAAGDKQRPATSHCRGCHCVLDGARFPTACDLSGAQHEKYCLGCAFPSARQD